MSSWVELFGRAFMQNSWRMLQKCENCPFHKTGPGYALRKSLRPGRFESIKRGLLRGQLFECHKTTDDEGNAGTGLLCAGAYEFMQKHEVSSQYIRICERLEARRT